MARPSAKPSTPAAKEPAKAPISLNSVKEPPKAPTPIKLTPVPARTPPSGDQIARRAYEIYLARGGQQGDPEQDWLQAERELLLSR